MCAGARLLPTPIQQLRAHTAESATAAVEHVLKATGRFTVLKGYVSVWTEMAHT